ncbi:MAG: type II toxin-antitoxin system RelE/ParE family toxin [Acidobacteria bacterium]|nr:type II toxin-antitoxin system RelE/ParE family toxin [Acidobacteriota bacterium]
MKHYVVAPDAAEDLDEIWEYIARDDIDAADRFLAKPHQQIRALAETPGMGHRREDLAEERPLLFWPVGNYLILYRAHTGFVEVVAVVRSRDIPSLLRRRGL